MSIERLVKTLGMAVGVLAVLTLDSGPLRAQTDAGTQAIVTWHTIALQTTAGAAFSPAREARALAMVSAAVFDAVNSITGDYRHYAVKVAARRSASIQAAVATAAHGVLMALYPEATLALDAARDSALSLVVDAAARSEGADVGRLAATALVVRRRGDRAGEASSYSPRSAVGAWVPTVPGFKAALDPGWGRVRPFLMDSGSQFRPGPPPEMGSEAYQRDLTEMRDVGSDRSSRRQQPETDAGLFWVSTAAPIWNQLVRQLATARRLGPGATARAYLLLNLAGADAMIAAWDAKYAYSQWRPVTAIRHASAGRDADSTWTPLIVTPPFPDYPAGHTAYAGAAERVLNAVFGEKPGELSITSSAAEGATRRFSSFAEIAEEVTNARVWAGVHWRTSSVAGRTLGRTVGDWALVRAPEVDRR